MWLNILFIFFTLSASVIGVLFLYLSWHFDYWHRRGVRGPRPQLLYGTFPKTNAGTCNLIEELHEIYLQYKSTEKFVGIFTARTPKLFILDPELALQILTQHFKHFHDNESSKWTRPSVEQMRLCSPFVSIGESWKTQRAELVPTLTANRIRAFYAAMCDSADKATKFIANAPGQALDAKQLANRYTAELMANYIWGVEAEAFTNATTCRAEFTSADAACPAPIPRMVNAMLAQSLDCVRYYGRTAAWPWLRLLRPVRFFPAASDRFFQQLLADALQARRSGVTRRNDVIDHLQKLSDKKSLNDVQIAGHTTTILIDGYETAALLIAHALLLLSRNTRVQQKLRAELLDNVATCNNYEALNELPYLEQCLQETLRLFPPLPTLFKLCTEPVTLQNSNGDVVALQPGDTVYISAYSFHHDADFFENPEEFWPERFSAELGGVRKYRDLGVFLPFGDGPRMCPGMKLGLAEAKVAVATIVQQFSFKPSNDTRTDNKIEEDSFLLTLKGGIEIIFEKL